MNQTNKSTDPVLHDQCLQEVMAAYLNAVHAGHSPDRKQLLKQHSELAQELEEFFADHDQMERLMQPLRSTAPAGRVGKDEGVTIVLGQEAVAAESTLLRSFGEYELLEEIARGGMGVVYRARHASLNRVVALKMILAGTLASAADVQRFRREAENAANLDHPNIVPIYEVGEHNGQPYFSMKMIEGGSLGQRLGDVQLPLIQRKTRKDEHGQFWSFGQIANRRRQIARLVALVARAVHHAHQRGILHRDLKPANILLDNQGQPHVTDFGLAKRVAGDAISTQSGMIVGTPSYIAPEQAAGQKGLTTAVDVYSLGVILYELLTGRPPFRAETPMGTLLQVVEKEPERPSLRNWCIGQDLETICVKCLAKEPQRRYGNAAELADDLERFVAGKPIAARPLGMLRQGWRWCRRNPLAAGSLAAVAASLLVGAGVAFHFAVQATDRARYADQQKNIARQRFHLARQAVDNFSRCIGDGPEMKAAGLETLRIKLLESATDFYRQLAQEKEADEGVDPAHNGRALAYSALGQMYLSTGQYEEAESAFQEALRIHQTSAAAHPDVPEYQNSIGTTYCGLAEVYVVMGRAEDAKNAAETAVSYCKRASVVLRELKYPMELVTCLCSLGKSYMGTGQNDLAEKVYLEGLALNKELVAGNPDVPACELKLAGCLNGLGRVYRSRGLNGEAESSLSKAAAIYQRLATTHAELIEAPEQQEWLAYNHHQLAHTYQDAGRKSEAEDAFGKALSICQKLSSSYPKVVRYRRQLASIQECVGRFHRDSGQIDKAESAFRQAIVNREELQATSLGAPASKSRLGSDYCNMGHVMSESERFTVALEWYDKAIQILFPFSKEHGDSQSREHLRNAYWGRAQALFRLGRYTETVQDADRALECHDGEWRATIAAGRAVARAWAGDFSRALDEAKELAQETALPGSALYDLARVYSLAAAAAARNQVLPAERDRFAEQAAAKSVALLVRAKAAGYFQNGAQSKSLKEWTDFASLRSREDFKNLLADVDEEADSPGR